MPPVSVPSSDTWALYPSIGIIVLVMIVIFGALYLIWQEYKAYVATQEERRKASEKARQEWQAAQDVLRDERWQGFLERTQEAHSLESERDRAQLQAIATEVKNLVVNSQLLAQTVGFLSEKIAKLSDTLTGHIQVDDARFDVLFTDGQKKAIAEKIEEPKYNRRKRAP